MNRAHALPCSLQPQHLVVGPGHATSYVYIRVLPYVNIYTIAGPATMLTATERPAPPRAEPETLTGNVNISVCAYMLTTATMITLTSPQAFGNDGTGIPQPERRHGQDHPVA